MSTETRREEKLAHEANASKEPDFLPSPLGLVSEEGLRESAMSLSTENPYATIRDLPGLPGEPRESSYVEMKGPPASPPPPPLQDGQRQRQPQRDSGTYEQPSPLTQSEPSLPPAGATGHWNMGSRRGGERRKKWHDMARTSPLGGLVSNQA